MSVPQREAIAATALPGRRLPALFAGLALAWLLSPGVAAQGTFTVAGTVVSAADEQPIERATVDLLSTTEERTLQTTSSDELGRFAFHGLAKGTYVLRGEARGFTASKYQQHGTFSTGIVTGGEVSSESLKLELQPLGTLSGTVTDESAEPMRGAMVHIFRRENDAGESRMAQAGQVMTNDLGQYESSRLAPGTYFVAVTASPWYAIHPGGNGQAKNGMGVVAYQDPALDVAYPVTYYPEGSDPARAAAIEIDGNQARADLQLSPVPALTISLPHARGDGRGPLPLLEENIFDRPGSTPAQTRQSGDSLIITGLAPGDYTLRVNQGGRGGDRGMRVESGAGSHVVLTAGGPNRLPLNTTPPPARVRTTVQSADGGPLPPNVQVHLIASGDPDANAGAVGMVRQGEMEAEPGDYYFTVSSARRLVVRRVLVAGKPLASNDIHLRAGESVTCTLIVSEATHAIRGRVRKGGEPAGGAMVLLVPADQHIVLRSWFQQQSDLDGSFAIEFVPPGPYLLIALDEAAWAANWRSPEFLSAHLPHATPVLVPETLPAQVVLQEPLAVQPI